MRVQLLSLCCLLVLVGCNGQTQMSELQPSPAELTETTSSSTETALVPIQPTLSPSPSKVTLQPTSLTFTDAFDSNAISERGDVKVDCVSPSNQPTNGSRFDGIIIVKSFKVNTDVYLLDLNSGDMIELGDNNSVLASFSVSPNRKLFSYEALSKDNQGQISSKELIIRSAGEQLEKLKIDIQWYSPRWLTNEELLFTLSEPDPQSPGYDRYPPSLILFNPFSKHVERLDPDYPGILSLDPNMQWGFDGLTSYDPALTRVVYGYGNSEEGSSYRIWDPEQDKFVAQIKTGRLPGSPPVWSIDGSQFLVTLWENSAELHSISRDGAIGQLTHLTDYVESDYEISHYVWSPNNNYLAFFFRSYDSNSHDWGEYTLVVYDVPSKKTIFTCVYADYGGKAINQFSGDPQAPIWSPDSSMILLEQRYELERSRLLLINLMDYQWYLLGEDLRPLGWILADG